MGKAADNEKIKLEAQYWNGLAIGTLVAGWFLPLTALGLRVADQGFSWTTAAPSLIAIAVTQYISLLFRKAAQKTIEKTKD